MFPNAQASPTTASSVIARNTESASGCTALLLPGIQRLGLVFYDMKIGFWRGVVLDPPSRHGAAVSGRMLHARRNEDDVILFEDVRLPLDEFPHCPFENNVDVL